ncbi:hypothetical protein DPMN_048405 [Dreissena polymorpha]|uniref:Uncharacterized protein n=1 Tax=Dreissena polymorpha TaxID=45954 RepID=A0A9D4DB68_DREPO|nr:hypothetical protein DPMN_048405 [Dreissena polymorpha]
MPNNLRGGEVAQEFNPVSVNTPTEKGQPQAVREFPHDLRIPRKCMLRFILNRLRRQADELLAE